MASRSVLFFPFPPRSILASVAGILVSIGATSACRAQLTSWGDVPCIAMTPTGVNLATGEYCVQYRETDLALPGPMSLAFDRYYASFLEASGVPPSALGTNWRGTYDWNLMFAGPNASVIDCHGRTVRFQLIPTGWQLLEPTYAPFQLVADGQDFLFLDATSQRVYRFDSSGRLTQVLDERGPIFSLIYASGKLSHVDDGLGRALDLAYDPPGHLISVTDGFRTVHYGHTGNLLTSYQDAANRLTTYAYAAPAPLPGLLRSETKPMGNVPLLQTYDALGRVAQQADALGHTATFNYLPPSGDFEITEWNDFDVQAWTLTHEIGHALGASHRVVTVQNPTGGTSSFGYDVAGRPNSFARPSGAVLSVNYDPASGRPSQIFRPGGSLALELTWTGTPGPLVYRHLTGLAFPDGATEAFIYDAGGNLIRWVDRGGFPWQWTYGARGTPLTFTNPAGDVTSFTYNPGLDLTGFSNGALAVSNILYSPAHDGLECQWLDGTTRHWTYDDRHRVTGYQNEASVWNFHVWNDNAQLASTTDGLGHTTQYQYDSMDRPVGVTDPLAQTLAIGRDGLGRPTAVTDRSGRTTGYVYDGLSRLIRAVDPASNQTLLGYDPDSRLLTLTDPLSHSLSWGWDAFDRVISSTDAVGEEEQYEYDAMDRPISSLGPLGYQRTLGYDARGLLTTLQVATLGMSFQRHSLGGMTGYTDPDGKLWSASFDGTGRVASRTDPLGRVTQYDYDARDRRYRVVSPLVTETATFDPTSRVTGIDFTGGPLLEFAHDSAGRLTSASGLTLGYDAANRIVSSNGLTFTRDPDGRLLSETYGPGKTVTYAYDSRGLLASVTDWLGGTTTFAHDAAGRRTTMLRPNGLATTYEYDAMSRLVRSSTVDGLDDTTAAVTFTRNARGMVVGAERRTPLMPGVTGADSTGWAYDDASQTTTFTHDALGRVTDDGVRTYTWDGASRLTSFTEGVVTESFTYDALGRMLSSTLGASTHTFVWNYAGDMATLDVDQESGSSNELHYFIHAPSGELLYTAEIDGLTTHRRFYHHDENGNTIFLTGDAGYVTAAYAYLPHGASRAIGQTAGNPYSFQCWQGFMELASPSGGLYWVPGIGPYEGNTGRTLDLRVSVPKAMEVAGPLVSRVADRVSNGVPFDFGSETLGNGSFDQGAAFSGPPRIFILLPSSGPMFMPVGIGGTNFDSGAIPYFKSVSGISVEHEIVEYKEGGLQGTSHRKPRAGSIPDIRLVGSLDGFIHAFYVPSPREEGVWRLDPVDAVGQNPGSPPYVLKSINPGPPALGLVYQFGMLMGVESQPGRPTDWVLPYLAEAFTPHRFALGTVAPGPPARPPLGLSGISELPGNDFIKTLGRCVP